MSTVQKVRPWGGHALRKSSAKIDTRIAGRTHQARRLGKSSRKPVFPCGIEEDGWEAWDVFRRGRMRPLIVAEAETIRAGLPNLTIPKFCITENPPIRRDSINDWSSPNRPFCKWADEFQGGAGAGGAKGFQQYFRGRNRNGFRGEQSSNARELPLSPSTTTAPLKRGEAKKPLSNMRVARRRRARVRPRVGGFRGWAKVIRADACETCSISALCPAAKKSSKTVEKRLEIWATNHGRYQPRPTALPHRPALRRQAARTSRTSAAPERGPANSAFARSAGGQWHRTGRIRARARIRRRATGVNRPPRPNDGLRHAPAATCSAPTPAPVAPALLAASESGSPEYGAVPFTPDCAAA